MIKVFWPDWLYKAPELNIATFLELLDRLLFETCALSKHRNDNRNPPSQYYLWWREQPLKNHQKILALLKAFFEPRCHLWVHTRKADGIIVGQRLISREAPHLVMHDCTVTQSKPFKLRINNHLRGLCPRTPVFVSLWASPGLRLMIAVGK